MVAIRLLVSNPSAVHVETDDGDCVVAGLRPDRVVDAIDASSTFDAIVEHRNLVQDREDYEQALEKRID